MVAAFVLRSNDVLDPCGLKPNQSDVLVVEPRPSMLEVTIQNLSLLQIALSNEE